MMRSFVLYVWGEILHSYDEIMYVHMLKCLIMNNLVLLESTSDARALIMLYHYTFDLHPFVIGNYVTNYQLQMSAECCVLINFNASWK